MMRKFCAIWMSLIFLTSCGEPMDSSLQQWMQPSGKLKVLSSIEMIEDLVQQVGGEHVDTHTLITGNLDPHTYQLVKGDDEKLAFAQLIVINGLGLEHGPSLREQLKTSKKVLSLGDRLNQEYPGLVLHYNGSIDPHIWMDISMWEKTVSYIVEALSRLDPSHAEDYRSNGQKLIERMQRTHEEVKRTLQEVPDEKRYLVTSHDAFNYFARAYLATEEEVLRDTWQNRFAAPEGLAPESQLSTTDIQFIIDYMKKYDIRVLFSESNVSQDSIRKILDAGREKGMELQIASAPLYGDAMGRPGSPGDTYLEMIQYNADTITKYLKNSYEKSSP